MSITIIKCKNDILFSALMVALNKEIKKNHPDADMDFDMDVEGVGGTITIEEKGKQKVSFLQKGLLKAYSSVITVEVLEALPKDQPPLLK